MRADCNALPDAPGHLMRRMTALDLDPVVVASREPGAFGDLRTLCAKCPCPERCERDLQSDPRGRAWKAYCPNCDLLSFMTEMWWFKTLL